MPMRDEVYEKAEALMDALNQKGNNCDPADEELARALERFFLAIRLASREKEVLNP